MVVILVKIMAVSVLVYFFAQYIGINNPEYAKGNKLLNFITVSAGTLMVLSLMLYTCRAG